MWMWVDVEVSFYCDFFFLFLLVVVVIWVVGFVVTVGIVVAGGAKNSWVEKERDRGERGQIKNY